MSCQSCSNNSDGREADLAHNYANQTDEKCLLRLIEDLRDLLRTILYKKAVEKKGMERTSKKSRQASPTGATKQVQLTQ